MAHDVSALMDLMTLTFDLSPLALSRYPFAFFGLTTGLLLAYQLQGPLVTGMRVAGPYSQTKNCEGAPAQSKGHRNCGDYGPITHVSK